MTVHMVSDLERSALTGSRQGICKVQQEMDRQFNSIKSLNLRLKTSMQNYEELSSQFVQLQMQVTANTESQKLLQHLTGQPY